MVSPPRGKGDNDGPFIYWALAAVIAVYIVVSNHDAQDAEREHKRICAGIEQGRWPVEVRPSCADKPHHVKGD